MEIKGTAVKSIKEFVKSKFPDKYVEWLDSLSEPSRFITNSVVTSGWYPLQEAAIEPTQKVGRMFYQDIKKGAWECGRYSAESALTGIYKIYVKFSSPGHIMDRASRIFQAYYRPSNIEVIHKTAKSVTVAIDQFPQPDSTIEYRIAGWMECALEISGCKNVLVNTKSSMAHGDKNTTFEMTWD